jgi:iron complex outermembrane receptor protein
MKSFSSLLPVLFSSTFAVALLGDDAVQLDDVVVTTDKEKLFSLPLDAAASSGSRLGLANRELPASVSVVTQEVMQLRGFRTAVEAVEGAVGMTGGTQFGSIPGYATRGFTGNSVSILRDGIRQNTASQSSRTIDSFTLDRVEVLKGPASLLFGEGAVGGAVNYLSKSPDRTRRGEVLASVGAWNHRRIGVGLGGPVVDGRLFYRADFSRTERDGYVERNGQRYTAFSGALGWEVSPNLRLTLHGSWFTDWNESYYGNPVIYDAVDRYDPATSTFNRLVARAVTATDRLVNPRVDSAARRTNYNILDNYAETENAFMRLRAEWTLADGWELRNETYAATQLLRWRNLESNLWNPVTGRVDRSSFVHIYRDDVLLGNRLDLIRKSRLLGRENRFLIGGFFERNDLIRGGTPSGYATTLASVSLLDPDVGFGPGDPDRFQKNNRVRIETAAIYAENMLEVSPHLKLVLGLRHDLIDLERLTLVTPANPTPGRFVKGYAPTTGRAGLVWSVNRDVNVYASYSRAAEPVTQLVTFSATQNDFSLQTGRQFELGAKGSLADGKVDFTFAVYDIEKNDVLSSTLDPDTGLRISQQIGAQVSQGTELSVAWLQSRTWRLEANLAWTWTAEFKDFNENLGTGVISRAGNRPGNVPEVVANLHLSRTLGRHWRIAGGPRYVGERAVNNANLIWTPAYTAVDASIAYERNAWSVTVRGRNLLDKDYEEWAAGLMRRLADPRNVEVSARWRF